MLTISSNEKADTGNRKIKYIPVGDSYTIGEGVAETGRWPNQMVKNLGQKNINIEILDNPAVSGFTVMDAMTYELPVIKKLKPDIVSVLIGANDNFQMTDVKTFEREYEALIDEIQRLMADPRNILLITIPDHTVSPAFKMYGGSPNASESIVGYNDAIKRIAKEKNLPVADIYPVSQQMNDPIYFSQDGLHPSSLGYSKWEEVISQKFMKLLSE